MKNLLCPGLLLICSLWGANTQAQGFRFGIRAGANLSTAAGPDANKPEAIWGPAAGLVANVPLTPSNFFSFQPELLYSRKGYWMINPSVSSPTRVLLHYLNLPLLAKIKVGGLVLEAGPQVGYLLDLRDYSPIASNRDPNKLDPYRRWELGYLAGIGYELKNGVGVGVRYNAGLTHVRQVPTNVTPLRFHNAAFQFQLSYLVTRR
ncbi:porin family protein [Hymenobacter crusticola]|uniref:porin family protein n=1 Tax=Hymenobacter crusticola TaxID=1770526 RepID=UPI000A3CB2C0|nr:porin family protein [Hymenobacter crusticola]